MTLNCTVNQKDIYEGLYNLQSITNKKGSLSILTNVLIETTDQGFFLTGTDLEIGLQIFIPSKIYKNGKLTLPSKKLFEIVRESGDQKIEIQEKDNNWVYIKAGESSYNLAGMSSSEFPKFPEYDNTVFTKMESHIFQELIDKTMYSIANEQENIYTLTSVLFEKEVINNTTVLKMISSDGHRLTIMEKFIEKNLDNLQLKSTTLIPKKGVQEWKKFCDLNEEVEISFEEKQLILKSDKAIMVIRLKEGEFPNYKAIIETVDLTKSIKIKKLLFLDSLKRINLFTEDIFNTISFKIDNNKLILSSENIDLGNARDQIKVVYDGEPLSLAFNCKYFIDTLQVMEGEYIDAYINSNTSPSLIKSEEDTGFISIIMPMQI